MLCKPFGLIKKLVKAKQETPAGRKPELVKTYLRNAIIFPEMIGSTVGVYNGKMFKKIGIRPEMVGHYLGEFSLTRKRRPHVTNTPSKKPSPRK